MSGGFLQVVTNSELDAMEADQAAIAAERDKEYKEAPKESLSLYIGDKYRDFQKIRETRNLSGRLIESLRSFNGQYSPSKLAEIQKFGGSEVFARTTATKCRGATAMLRDIYLGAERPWFMDHTPVPKVPGEIESSVLKLVQAEVQDLAEAGQMIDPQQIEDRIIQLRQAAEQAALKKAKEEAKATTKQVEDVLVEGGFYEALGECLLDLTVFPYAVMNGPVIEMANVVEWEDGKAVSKQKPKMFWKRTNPFDLYWASGAVKFEDADVIERVKITPAELMNLKGVKGYSDKAIDKVIEQYAEGGLNDWHDDTQTEEARLESREDPYNNDSNMIDSLKWHGKIQGKLLKEWNFPEVKDENAFYTTIAWVVGDQVIKCVLDPNPRKRHTYFMTSFEKIPGAIIGHGIPELIHDIQSVMNATLRSLVNNLSISSGPQVVVDLNQIGEGTNPNDIFPWKRWMVESDPLSPNQSKTPVTFYQPNSNAQELLMVFQQMSNLADEVSTIPKYMTGSEKVGGAGRTASGLSMLMGASSKVLQSVAGNVDNDIIGPALTYLHEILMLTSPPGTFRGDETVRVRGVNFSVQKETERMRSLEFLQMTANPIDMGIIGTEGRAEVLRKVADALGMDHATIVPDENTLAAQMQQGAANGQGQPAGLPPGSAPNEAAGQVDEPIQGMVPTG